MKFLNRNQYAILFSYRCNYECSYCCTRSSPTGPRSEVEANTQTIINLFNKIEPGCILLSGGEPALWKDFPIILNALPQHYWIVLSNLFILPKWINHPNIKLIIPAYHEEFAKEQRFTEHVSQLKEMNKRVHIKIIVKPEREYRQINLWEKWNSMGIPASFTPLEYTYYFNKEFLKDIILKFRTCSLYNARFFRVNKFVDRLCIAGTEKAFEVNPDGQIVRCSTVWTSVGDIYQPKFNQESQYCTSDNCYCEWHHWSEMTSANDNFTWTKYIDEGVWKIPTVEELSQFILDMNWDVAGRNVQKLTEALFTK